MVFERLLSIAEKTDVLVEGFRPGVAERLGFGPEVVQERNTAFMHGMHAAGMWNELRGHNMVDGAAPFYDSYRCADGGYAAVGCFEPQFYRELLEGREIDQDGLAPQMDRSGWPHLRRLIGEKFAERSRDEWASRLVGSDACVTPVLSPREAHQHPHNEYRGSFVEVAGLVQPAPAPRFDRTPNPNPRPPAHADADVDHFLTSWGIQATATL